MAQLYFPVLQAVQQVVTGLGLALGGAVLPVQLLREAVTRDGLPDLPKLTVSPCQGDGGELMAAGMWDGWYAVQVALVAASNLDLKTALEEILDFRKSVMDGLKDPGCLKPFGVGSVMMVDVLPDPTDPLDRGSIPQGLDFSSVRVRFHCLEDFP